MKFRNARRYESRNDDKFDEGADSTAKRLRFHVLTIYGDHLMPIFDLALRIFEAVVVAVVPRDALQPVESNVTLLPAPVIAAIAGPLSL